MHLERYSITSNSAHEAYEFYSEGPKGIIKKVVVFQPLKALGNDYYNLAFGDWNNETQRIVDDVRTNNNDRDKVLATVSSVIMDFVKYFPKATILIQGQTPSKTRLYQMGIAIHHNDISKLFLVLGFANDNWEIFKTGNNYEAFVLQSKKL